MDGKERTFLHDEEAGVETWHCRVFCRGGPPCPPAATFEKQGGFSRS